MYEGSCLCKSIKFAISGELFYGRYCHCEHCRKYSGTSGAAWSVAEASNFEITKSDSEISGYDTGKGTRFFCSNCGSPVYSAPAGYPEIVGVPLGAIDSDNAPKPELRVWVRSAKDWEVIPEGLPQHDTHP